MLNTADGCIPVVDAIQCPKTKECQNDQCFWRQRDIHGLNPFPIYKDESGKYPFIEKNNAVCEKFGRPYFPELTVSVGTNCLYLCCPDFRK